MSVSFYCHYLINFCVSVSASCVFCYSEEENEELYGKMLKKSGIIIHYFCMVGTVLMMNRMITSVELEVVMNLEHGLTFSYMVH